ncbi:iron ABC transporter substrate-binding protein [Desulfococcus sp.]|uniref:iron ABC transporter substrate-binding protein n=1 Tax=Desulfococcus sp. TaxID=2025834 RepID=UPI003593E982
MKYLRWIAGLLISLILTSAPVAAEPVTVTDMAGRTVTAPRDPERIIAIGPGTLRLMVYLEAHDKVAGVEDMEKANPGGRPYWIAHPELARLPRCGPGGPAGINKKPDMEALVALAPQVIFTTYMDAALADEVQKTLGIPVVVLSYGAFATFDEAVYDSLEIAGKIVNRGKRADTVIGAIEAMRIDLRKRTEGIPEDRKPGVYVGGIGYRGAHGIESTEVSYVPLAWTGARNLAEQVPSRIGSHVFVDKETLLRLNPDVIFIDGGGLALVAEDFRRKPQFYASLNAFQTRRVYILLPFNSYTTNIDTALADAYAIGKILYPERFRDIDPEAKADEIYTFFLGRPVYREMALDFGPIGQVAPFLK